MLREATGLQERDLKRLEGRELLKHDMKNGRGWALYKVERIQDVKQYSIMLQNEEPSGPLKFLPAANDPTVTYSTEECHAVFALIREGKSLVEVFMETRIHPAILNAIVKDYERLSGSWFVAKPIIDSINALPLEGVGTIHTGVDLLEAMKRVADEVNEARKCLGCKKKTRAYCASCAPGGAPKVVASAPDRAPHPQGTDR